MKLLLIRHGHGEHLLHYPAQLNRRHPRLTPRGRQQIATIKPNIFRRRHELFLVSPTVRTIQSALLLTSAKHILITPLVGPRMYPVRYDIASFGCDIPLNLSQLQHRFANIACDRAAYIAGGRLWRQGINHLDSDIYKLQIVSLFTRLVKRYKRIVIVSHDGTITSIREALGEVGLSRASFLGEAGLYEMDFSNLK